MLSFDSKYDRQLINATFLKDKHNINAVSENVMFNLCFRCNTGERLDEPRRCSSFEASYAYMCILRHCTIIIYIHVFVTDQLMINSCCLFDFDIPRTSITICQNQEKH